MAIRNMLRAAAIGFIGLSGVSAFAPAGVARVGSTGLCMSAGGSGKIKQVSDIRQDPRKKLAPAGQVPFSGKGQYDAREALGLQDVVDTTYSKPPSTFNFGNKPAAKPVPKPAAKPVARAAPKPAAKPVAKPAARAAPKPAAKPAARPATTGTRLGSNRFGTTRI